MNPSESESSPPQTSGLQVEVGAKPARRFRAMWLVLLLAVLAVGSVTLTAWLPRSSPAPLSIVSPLSTPGFQGASSTLSRFVRESDLILIARVSSLQSAYEATGKFIFTRVTLVPITVLKGKQISSPFVVRQIGGTVGRTSQGTSGTPSFREGEEVLVFLAGPDAINEYVLYSARAKFTLRSDPVTFNNVAVIDSASREVSMSDADQGFVELLSRSERGELPVNELVDFIRLSR